MRVGTSRPTVDLASRKMTVLIYRKHIGQLGFLPVDLVNHMGRFKQALMRCSSTTALLSMGQVRKKMRKQKRRELSVIE